MIKLLIFIFKYINVTWYIWTWFWSLTPHPLSNQLILAKVACRNLFGLLPKAKTLYIVPKRWNCEIAKPAETAETSITKFLHSFGVNNINILIRFRHSFDMLRSLKKKNKMNVRNVLKEAHPIHLSPKAWIHLSVSFSRDSEV